MTRSEGAVTQQKFSTVLMKIEYDLMQLLHLHSFQYNNSAKINLCNANFTYWVKYFAIKMLILILLDATIYQE